MSKLSEQRFQRRIQKIKLAHTRGLRKKDDGIEWNGVYLRYFKDTSDHKVFR